MRPPTAARIRRPGEVWPAVAEPSRRRRCGGCTPAGAADRISIVRLGMPDGEVEAVQADLTAALASALRGADWCLAPLAWDGHPDHEASGAAARDACGDRVPLASYPIWAWHWATPSSSPLERAIRVPLSPAGAGAQGPRAVDCFASQYEPVEGGPVVPPHVRVRFERPFEVLLAMTHVPVSSFEELYRADPRSLAVRDEQRTSSGATTSRVACLPRARYGVAFEPGCAIGELTRRLAARCDRRRRARRRADRGGRGAAAVPVARACRGAAG